MQFDGEEPRAIVTFHDCVYYPATACSPLVQMLLRMGALLPERE